MDMNRCFLIGHRQTEEGLYRPLYTAIERHIVEKGVTEFWVGHHGGFDRLAARVLRDVKQRYPSIRLFLLLAYHPAVQAVALPAGFDGLFYPPGLETVPKRFAIVRANRYAVQHCRYLIAYVWQITGNSAALVRYARTKKDPPYITILPTSAS